MCWKYEELYPGMCVDRIVGETQSPEDAAKQLNIITFLEDCLGAEIKDASQIADEFHKFLTKLHESGAIVPSSRSSNEFGTILPRPRIIGMRLFPSLDEMEK